MFHFIIVVIPLYVNMAANFINNTVNAVKSAISIF